MEEKEVKEKVNQEEEKDVSNKENIETDEEVVEDIEMQEDVVGKLNEQIAKLKNDYARAYADTENIKRRLTKEAEDTRKYRIQSFALEILPVIDNLERALSSDCQDEQFKKGIEMIYNQLITALKNEGVKEIDCLNQKYDANYAQALMSEKKEGVEPNTVTQILQKGYMLKDRVLRAAMVKISE